MRLLVFLLFGVFSVACQGQNDDLHIAEGRIIYQHVFDGSIENPLEFIENLKGVSNVRELNGAYFGDVRVLQTDVKSIMTEVGLRWGNTMIFLQSADSKSQVQIEVKDDRYRVTVSDILLDFTNPTMGSDKPLELYNLKKNGDLRPKQWSQTKLVYDYLFNDWFSGVNIAESDDW